jgi:hypothetical protein
MLLHLRGHEQYTAPVFVISEYPTTDLRPDETTVSNAAVQRSHKARYRVPEQMTATTHPWTLPPQHQIARAQRHIQPFSPPNSATPSCLVSAPPTNLQSILEKLVMSNTNYQMVEQLPSSGRRCGGLTRNKIPEIDLRSMEGMQEPKSHYKARSNRGGGLFAYPFQLLRVR